MLILNDGVLNILGLIGAILGPISVLLGVIYRLLKFWRLSIEISKWKKKIKGTWYSYNVSYLDGKKIITGYEWNFGYSWFKGKYVGKAQSLRDKSVGYCKVELHFEGDYIFLTAKGTHKGEYIFGILHEVYPIAETNRINAVVTGLSYTSKIPFSAEMKFMKDKPNLLKLMEETPLHNLASRLFDLQ